MSDAETRRLLATALRILAVEGHGHLNFGHASARVDDVILVKRRGTGFEEADPSSLARMDLAGNDLDTGRPSGGEMPLHVELYRARPEVRCVVHTHPPAAVAFSAFPDALRFDEAWSADELPFVERGVGFYASPKLVETAEMGRALADALGLRRVAVLANHGIAAVGTDVVDATMNAILLERALRRRMEILRLGTALAARPHVIKRAVALEMSGRTRAMPLGRDGGREASLFDYLARVADRRFGPLA